MAERTGSQRLDSRVQLDDACLGAERSGGKRGRRQDPVRSRGGEAGVLLVNAVLGNLKTALRSSLSLLPAKMRTALSRRIRMPLQSQVPPARPHSRTRPCRPENAA
ncbi:MAG: hypothetical protein OXF73_03920, partial [Gammaproteobacteria bacterium]|nr:hypothetical protein [Gammaproteobacteria bacterium]